MNTAAKPLSKPAGILILVGSIVQTVGTFLLIIYGILMSIVVGYSFFDEEGMMYHDYTEFYTWPMVTGVLDVILVAASIIAIVMLVLAWLAYRKTMQNHRGWTIYGLVQSVLCANVPSIIGYIFALIDLNDAEVLSSRPIDQLDEQIEQLKQELDRLNAQKDNG